jgi:hypothetical protein
MRRVRHMGKNTNMCKFLMRNLKERDNLEDVGIAKSMILK